VFGPPKRGKTGDVPLPESVALALAEPVAAYPPLGHVAVAASGRRAGDREIDRVQPEEGVNCADGFHALRHFYASTPVDDGETITALAEYLGHSDLASPQGAHPAHAVQRGAGPAGR